MKGFNDPALGTYSLFDSGGQRIWLTRKTPSSGYLDDVEFTFVEDAGTTCNIVAQSRSQSLSVYDYNTNYCNMYNIFRGIGVSFTKPVVSQCLNYPADKDVLTTCDKN